MVGTTAIVITLVEFGKVAIIELELLQVALYVFILTHEY